MSDPNPKPGELWEIRGLVDHEISPRMMLITRVYTSEDYSDIQGRLVYDMIEGVVEGQILSLGTGWLLRRLLENEE
jgi:hypothetical protein